MAHGPKVQQKSQRKGDNSSYLLLGMIGNGFHDDGGLGLVQEVGGETEENLSKLPLGRASGALLEEQLERSIAVVHQSTLTGSTRLPSQPLP